MYVHILQLCRILYINIWFVVKSNPFFKENVLHAVWLRKLALFMLENH